MHVRVETDLPFGPHDSMTYVAVATKEHLDRWLNWLKERREKLQKLDIANIVGIVELNETFGEGDEGDYLVNWLIMCKFPDSQQIAQVHHLLWKGTAPDNAWLNGVRVW